MTAAELPRKFRADHPDIYSKYAFNVTAAELPRKSSQELSVLRPRSPFNVTAAELPRKSPATAHMREPITSLQCDRGRVTAEMVDSRRRGFGARSFNVTAAELPRKWLISRSPLDR